MTGFIATPNQASKIFSLDGPSGPRQKNLFLTRFRRATDAATSSSTAQGTWQKDLGFLVKSVDRPSVQPQTEELNQYNKKRQIYTGYKVQPVRMTIYDTVDSMAMQMWTAYIKSYMGDFRHDTTASDWRYDVTAAQFLDSGEGFGFAPQGGGTDDNSQFFFDSIQVFQVFGDKFVQFDLINPKITAFDPDDLDYSNSEVGMFNLTIAYEAILYMNEGKPQPLSASEYLSEMFADARYTGQVLDIDDATQYSAAAYAGYSYPPQAAPVSSYSPDLYAVQAQDIRYYDSGEGQGTLTAYGDFTFGSTASTAGNLRAPNTDLSIAAMSNPALASALSLSNVTNNGNGGSVLTNPYSGTGSMDASMYDVARSAVNTAGGGNGAYDSRYMADAVTSAVITTAIATGKTPRELVKKSNKGMGMHERAYGLMNAQRPCYSQIGYNRSAQSNGGEGDGE